MSRLTFDTTQDAITRQNIQNGFSNNVASGKLSDVMPQDGQPILLNLGCGLDVRDGFINIDMFSDNPKVVRMDIRKLEIPDNFADFILASDVLEHFSHHQTDSVLSEWYRVLKPSAQIIIRCPSLRLQLKAYSEHKWNADIASYMIFGGQTNPGDFHCVGFDETSIKLHLQKAGFEVISFEEVDTPQDNGYINLNMTVKAIKPATNKQADLSSHSNSEIKEENKISNDSNLPAINIVWEGSQFVYHSLALVNREHCKNLLDADVANVTIVPYEADTFSPNVNPNYQKLYDNDIRYKPDVSEQISNLPYVWIRHQWPPQAEVPQGAKWIIMQPWEYSKFPERFVNIFKQADELWTPSNYSRQAFINSGIESDKVQIIPNGIDPKLFTPIGETYKLETKKKFKFLYVGGTTYRKGFDILLKAYTMAFKNSDDVCLVVKDMGGDSFYKGQTAEQAISNLQANPNAPEIEYIKAELSEQDMPKLYRACDMFVCAYRGEGFSLPTLEAMACGLSVIVPRGGATDDFTTEENAWYVNSDVVPVPNNNTDYLPADATMLEPNLNELVITLDYVVKNPVLNYGQGLIGSYLARKFWTWRRATLKLLTRLDYLYNTDMAQIANNRLEEYEDVFMLLGEAELAFQKDEYTKSEQLFIIAVEANELPDRELLHSFNRLALIAIKKNKLIDAYKYNESSKALDNANPDTKWIEATLLSAEEKYDEALEILAPFVEDWQNKKHKATAGIDLEKYILLMADCLFAVHDLEKAAQVYETALRYNNYSPEACYGLGRCYKQAGLNDDARNMFEWALKYKPDFENARIEMEGL
jgi:glycosyltransferase involved in cell wall biosynthesis/predicted SAM-dependent methyltransferase/Tfp pilus assembly protein PilF